MMRSTGILVVVLVAACGTSGAPPSTTSAAVSPTAPIDTTTTTTTARTSSTVAPATTTTKAPEIEEALLLGSYQATLVASDGREVPDDPRTRSYEFTRECVDCPIIGSLETGVGAAEVAVVRGPIGLRWTVEAPHEATDQDGTVTCRWDGVIAVEVTPTAANTIDGVWTVLAGTGTVHAVWANSYQAEGVQCEAVAEQYDSMTITRS
ncbi:MAG: hypothetical protein OEW30_08215 [Acidimicrobiia bacterium]|nr:hypothetical protein [Acidimicrobiia bacterium]